MRRSAALACPREGGGRSYACRSGPGLDGCGGIRIQAKGVERHVRDLVCGMLADPEPRAVLAGFDADGKGDNGTALVEELRSESRRNGSG